jgi:hypothetical protein
MPRFMAVGLYVNRLQRHLLPLSFVFTKQHLLVYNSVYETKPDCSGEPT